MTNAADIQRSTAASEPPSVRILGVRIDNITPAEALVRLTAMALSGMPHHVMTVNPEFVMLAQENKAFGEAMERADLCLADGIGIVVAARMHGTTLGGRITGSDTIPALASIAAREGISLFLLGAAPGVAERTAEILQRAHPGLQIAGTFSGSPRPEEEDAICALIEKAHPHVLLVAYGPPKQDLWIARTQDRLRVPLAIGVGGTFDFIAGVAKRAPVWVQSIGLEWLYRLLREPRRWRRMLTLPRFAAAVLVNLFTMKRTGKNGD